MADHRHPSVVGQRTLAVEPEPPAENPPPPFLPNPVDPDPGVESPSRLPPVFREVISSSDAIWERRVRWMRAREKFEASIVPAEGTAPPEK
jgi:hypothetical protein